MMFHENLKKKCNYFYIYVKKSNYYVTKATKR